MDISVSLIRQCKEMNNDAFNTLFKQYEHFVYRICYGYVRNKEEALDITQEVYIKIIKSIQNFDESKPFLPWLRKITVNTSLNYIRDNQKHAAASLCYINKDTPSFPSLTPAISIEGQVIANSFKTLLDDSINNLPDNYRIVITLRYLEDMKYKEIADLLEQPLGSVKSTISRARAMLHKELSALGLLEV